MTHHDHFTEVNYNFEGLEDLFIVLLYVMTLF